MGQSRKRSEIRQSEETAQKMAAPDKCPRNNKGEEQKVAFSKKRLQAYCLVINLSL
jgi:hypothetical protein